MHNTIKVRKRDGSLQEWEPSKISMAMRKAFEAVRPRAIQDNPDSLQSILERLTEEVCTILSNTPIDQLSIQPQSAECVVYDIESDIQDTVERVLIREWPEVGKAYVLYRAERGKQRKLSQGYVPDPNALADYIHPAKYAKYDAAKRRRETYLETSHRSRDMHIKRFPELAPQIMDIWTNFVDTKRVLPSMRSMQFGGEKVLLHNAAMYNCSFTHIDRPRVFQEILYLLLCGCGVGFSVQKQHVAKLPKMGRINPYHVRHFSIPDSIEGWADAVGALIDAQIHGYYVEFDYSQIRPEGSPLHTSGGKAPGHLGLKATLDAIREILAAASGRHLRPLECYDIVCHIADAVLAGGVRRSSLIALFSLDDEEMLLCKTPQYFRPESKGDRGLNPHRSNSNNSAVFLRKTFDSDQFRELISINRNNPYGEPGFIFVDHLDYGTNPCGEIGLCPVLEVDPVDEAHSLELESLGFRPGEGIHGHSTMRATGFQFCNLCEINAAKFREPKDFLDAAYAAAFIGTLQASYTSFPYLGTITEAITRREALLGVGITGIMDAPAIALNPDLQRQAARVAIEANREIAAKIGIQPAARVTTVKPSGTASLELGGVGSGIHPHHARRYFRRVTANPLEPPAQYFRSINPHMVEEKPNGDWSLVFPIQAPQGAKTVKEMTALELMDAAISTKQNWVNYGTANPESCPGLTHNVSLTIAFRQEEWDDVLDRIIRDREHITAMSFFPIFSDKGIPFVPREEVVDEVDEERWRFLIRHYRPVDYSQMVEDNDQTARILEVACSGGVCDILDTSSGPKRSATGVCVLFEKDVPYGCILRKASDGSVCQVGEGCCFDGVQPGDVILAAGLIPPRYWLVAEGPFETGHGRYVLASRMWEPERRKYGLKEPEIVRTPCLWSNSKS